jgi:hypothetical protein
MSYETTSPLSIIIHTSLGVWRFRLAHPTINYNRVSTFPPTDSPLFLLFFLCRQIFGLVQSTLPLRWSLSPWSPIRQHSSIRLQHLFFRLRSALFNFAHIFASRLSFRYLASFLFPIFGRPATAHRHDPKLFCHSLSLTPQYIHFIFCLFVLSPPHATMQLNVSTVAFFSRRHL